MVNINFVPDDYVQNTESRRMNLIYLVLLGIVMVALGGAFFTIKIRQRAFDAKEKLVNSQLMRAKETIEKFEELQIKRKEMMKTALTTAELIEPVPRSVVLASLTNNLPSGVSLFGVNMIQKAPSGGGAAKPTSKYQQAQAKKGQASAAQSVEQHLETHIDIEGLAPSDLQVASYIEMLGRSNLLDNVALVESKEHKMRTVAQDDTITFGEPPVYRRFKLTAMLKRDAHLSSEDIERIMSRAEQSVLNF
jgi:Tfp pilus assembly protein PilN